MLRSKLGLLGLCAMVLGVMAISASAAQASLFEWLVLSKDGTQTFTKFGNGAGQLLVEVRGELEGASASLLTHVVGLSVEITCTSASLIGVHLAEEGKLTEGGKVQFGECEAYSLNAKGELEAALGCNVHSPATAIGSKSILTNEGKGALLLHTYKIDEPEPGVKVELTELVTKIEPKTGESFVTILTEGCALPESNTINGKLFLKDCELKAETHQVKHLIEQGPLTVLWIGKDTVEHLQTSIDGSAWVSLGGAHVGFPWAGKHNLP